MKFKLLPSFDFYEKYRNQGFSGQTYQMVFKTTFSYALETLVGRKNDLIKEKQPQKDE